MFVLSHCVFVKNATASQSLKKNVGYNYFHVYVKMTVCEEKVSSNVRLQLIRCARARGLPQCAEHLCNVAGMLRHPGLSASRQ